ncbi:DUF4817 domain-containing protein [Trichonephila clavipes]|nr:DUF4817 domain-containing protein [Trichonephila clavipes]
MQNSPSRVELAARGQNDKKESAGRKLYFHRTQTGCSMTEYTNAEKADMILAHGATDFNGRATQRLYAEKHPIRRTPAHTMFARLHQQLCGTGSFQKAARTELNEEIVLDMVETTPSLSTRGIANEIGISYSSVWRILDDSALHPFHYQYVQSLKECDFAPRQAFPQWYLQQRIANPFLKHPCCSQMRRLFRERVFSTPITAIRGQQRTHM